MTSQLPSVPVKHKNFIQHVQSHQKTPIEELLKPYNEYDALARKIYAQEPAHTLLKDNHANIVPLYDAATGSTDIRVRARDLSSETPEQKEKYILPLSTDKRRDDGSPAVVPTLDEFKNNFALFTEGALSELDWSNVIAAGSAVVTSLLPVPEQYRNSKRGLRQYYHDEFAPASDVDLFLYGLTEEQAIDKIKHIEDKIRNTILYETTTIRTKNTITIASQYPTRHVQIVLRIYRSVAEILTGFDVDCSCTAYDGHQVYASPRAIAAYITQTNQVDLTRRSPSYENRLSKYSHRGFEVFWSQLDRSKVDPTIFERSFRRTEGLARLLVLEQLPKPGDREDYLTKRREERGRPALSLYLQRRQGKELRGNIKDDWEDEVPEWQEEDQISDYHTFTIPYGRRFNARKIEKLLYTKDLLLNAQWNQKKDRGVYLHRHPAFFGEAEHVIGDCCGSCPKPVTDEERKVAEEESKIYISGNITFIKDNPGRQEIGSFNPITETDWTEMAYIGRTELLCQAIVSQDLESVKNFLDQEDSDPDRRDYTGRTPLQLACMSSTPEIVQCLVDHGARLIARMADGQTALHLAAARGATEIVRILLIKSNQNEEEEDRKAATTKGEPIEVDGQDADDGIENDGCSQTSASYVKVDKEDTDEVGPTYDTIEENELDPDIYDINVPAWDNLASPLHLAILHGHLETVEELVTSFGADVLLPIKITNDYDKRPKGAIMTLVLVLSLPLEKAREMSKTLLRLGASPAQADMSHQTALQYIAQSDYNELLDIYQEHDGPGMRRAINHLTAMGAAWYSSSFDFASALVNALCAKNRVGAKKLLELGAKPSHDLADWLKAVKSQFPDALLYGREERFAKTHHKQPIVYAIENDLPIAAIDLLQRGADPNTMHQRRHDRDETLLDSTNRYLQELRNCLKKEASSWYPTYGLPDPVIFEQDDSSYFTEFKEGTYKLFSARAQLEEAKENNKKVEEKEAEIAKSSEDKPGEAERREAITEMIEKYELLKAELLSRDAKTWDELHPGETQGPEPEGYRNRTNYMKKPSAKLFKVEFFSSLSGLSDIANEGYVKLFEAAWSGDLETIKSLALGMWGEDKDQVPLSISKTDSLGINCLQICILRGHLRTAKAILQILRTQYKVKEGVTHQHFEMDIDSDNESSDAEGLNIVGHIVDEQFTYEKVGEGTSQVESEVSPLQALERYCPVQLFLDEELPPQDTFRLVGMNHWNGSPYLLVNNLFKYAIFKNDVRLLEWLLNAAHESVRSDPSNKTPFTLGQSELQLAMSLGHTECLATIIKSTAVGLPLMKLSEESGIAASEEPEYYQGLSIRGQKRKDWADSGRPDNSSKTESPSRPPLLLSALQGNLSSTEWFLGTAPSRYYLEYVHAHSENDNIKRVAQSALGLDATVLKWLQGRNNLVLHCAVMARTCEESERLVQYLVDQHPECLEVRSSEGHTPLALAVSLQKVNFARILTKAGANQATRDNQGRNLLHLAVCSMSDAVTRVPDEIRKLVDLMDKELVSAMLTQRAGESSQTPFARWLGKSSSDFFADAREKDDTRSMTHFFLDLGQSTNQKFLELLDGTGNTPVHDCVKRACPQVLEPILDQRLDLLYRENATGSTPLDMAVDAWVNATTREVPQSSVTSNRQNQWPNITSRGPQHFIKNDDQRTRVEVMIDVCRKRTQQVVQKRRLVTLFEANEVAKRLATKKNDGEESGHRVNRYGQRSGREFRKYREDDDGHLDEVALWVGLASQWN